MSNLTIESMNSRLEKKYEEAAELDREVWCWDPLEAHGFFSDQNESE